MRGTVGFRIQALLLSIRSEGIGLAVQKWFKGNIHTHSNAGGSRTGYPNGDPVADSDPETVAKWYRLHGYDFLILTDHNHRTLLDYRPRQRRFRKPLMIPGEEVSVRIGQEAKAIHLGALGITRVVEPIDATDVVSTLQANVNAIRQAGGIAAINHPNFTWAFSHEEISQIKGAHLLEVYSGHPRVNMYGAGGRPGYSEIWDKVLSSGLPIWGVATDDSHHFLGEFGLERINPGRGWVVVRATRLDSDNVLNALVQGNFYASTGVVLDDLEQGEKGIYLRVRSGNDAVYTTQFLGREGSLLKETYGTEAIYEPSGQELYIRAQVVSSTGQQAWTQPIFVASARSAKTP